MEVNYPTNTSIYNLSIETEYYDSSTTKYSEDSNSEPVTEFSNETDYSFKHWDNFISLFYEPYIRLSLGWTLTLVVAYTIIFFVGFVGNCMVILVVIKRPQMRTVTNLFIMNLAVADLLVIIFCVPAELLYGIFSPWILGPVMCKIVRYMQWVSMCASAYSLTAISLDRCKAIYRPQAPPRGLSKQQALFTVCLIWILSVTLTIRYMLIFEQELAPYGTPICSQVWEGKLQDQISLLFIDVFVFYLLPLILISTSNIIIWRNVTKRKAPEESASSSRIDRMHRETRQSVGKMLRIVTLVFLLSWFPFYVLMKKLNLNWDVGSWENFVVLPMKLLLAFSNSSINPVLYAFMSKRFREAFKSLLPKWLLCIQRTENNGEKSCSFRETITSDISLTELSPPSSK